MLLEAKLLETKSAAKTISRSMFFIVVVLLIFSFWRAFFISPDFSYHQQTISFNWSFPNSEQIFPKLGIKGGGGCLLALANR
jgi:hypothetical protein